MEFNFENYLEVVEGIAYNYFDNNYSGNTAKEIIERYDAYDIADWNKDVELYVQREIKHEIFNYL